MKMKAERQSTRFSCSISRHAFTTFPAIWNGGERRFQLHEIRHGHDRSSKTILFRPSLFSSARVISPNEAFSRFPFRTEDLKFRRRGLTEIVSSNFVHDISSYVRIRWKKKGDNLIFFFLVKIREIVEIINIR